MPQRARGPVQAIGAEVQARGWRHVLLLSARAVTWEKPERNVRTPSGLPSSVRGKGIAQNGPRYSPRASGIGGLHGTGARGASGRQVSPTLIGYRERGSDTQVIMLAEAETLRSL